MRTTTIDITPALALQRLKEGNFRFVHNLKQPKDLIRQMLDTASKQTPFAVIVSCMDSRTSNELIFDLGIGDIFSIRIAGNIITEHVLGSIEFACKVAGAKFIVVLGHTNCGAIKGACDDVQLGHLSLLLEEIRPAVDAEKTILFNRNSSNPEFTDKVAKLHAQSAIHTLNARSPILRDMLHSGEIGIIAALYHVETGVVDFYENTLILHPQ